MKNAQYTYLLARLPMGMTFFGHGLERMPKLSAFAEHMAQPFQKSILPMALVTPFGYVLPFLELLTGILLLIGLFTRFSIVLGVLIMLALIFGSCMIEQWNNVFSQIVYAGYLAVLFYFTNYNIYAVDKLINKN